MKTKTTILAILQISLTFINLQSQVLKKAPELSMDLIIQGPDIHDVTLNKCSGKVIILEFWATWCKPCISNIQHLNELQSKLSDKNVCFISITNESEEKINSFIKLKKISGWVASDTDKSMFKAYNIIGLPTTIVINPNGFIELITTPDQLSLELIQSIIDGTYIPVYKNGQNKPELGSFGPGDDPAYTSFIKGGEPIPYQHIIRPSVNPSISNFFWYGTRTQDSSVGITLIDANLNQIYACAYNQASEYRIINSSSLNTQNKWDLIFSRSDHSSLEMAWKEIGVNLNAIFNVKIRFIELEKKVTTVTLQYDSFIIKESQIDWNNPNSSTYTGIDEILNIIETNSGKILIFDNPDHLELYIDTYEISNVLWNSNTPASVVENWIISKGFIFKSEIRKVTFLSIEN